MSLNPVAPWIALSLLIASLGSPAAAATPSGRWEGEARIPGAPQRIVLDLAPSPAGEWAGSLTLPGRGVKGAPLDALTVGADGSVQADAASAFGGPPSELPTQLAVRMLPDGRLEGELRQGGHAAALALRRSGDAQVDAPPARTALPAALAGTWRGRYELSGYPRDVTLTLQTTTSPSANAGELLIVGKRRSQLVIDRVNASERFVTLEASAAGIKLEGRWDATTGAFEGSFFQGPFEVPLKLQRDATSARSGSGS